MRRTFTNFKLAGFEHPVMRVEDGVIKALHEEGPALEGTVEDLGGAYILPAFNDCHCHILPTGIDLRNLALDSCKSPQDILDAVRDSLPKVEGWLVAVHYDQNKWDGGAHITRDQLDAISDSVPILLKHTNGHASVVNSAAIQAAGVTDSTEDPTGGTFVRDTSGRMNGLLLERAHETVFTKIPEPSLDEMVDLILRASEAMAAYGITAASDMMTGQFHLLKELEAYRIASEKSRVRYTLWLQWGTVLGPRGFKQNQIEEIVRRMDPKKCSVGGLKIFSDGAIGSATAAIYGRFETDPDDGRTESGKLIYSPERLTDMVVQATQRNYPVAVHAIGDRAVDRTLDAFEASGQPFRHRLEHAMILSDAQITRIGLDRCQVTMQPEFLSALGHAYKKQLGDRAPLLKRARSVWDKGIPLAFSSDRPIVSGDPWLGILAASDRPKGFDPSENLTRAEAINAYTHRAAIAGRDGQWLGCLREGFVADFCTYTEDPLTAKKPKVKKTYFGGE